VSDRAREHLHGFLRSLDDAGVRVGAEKRADFLRAVALSPPGDVDGLYWRARLTLVSRAEDFALFDIVFDAWFRGGHLLVEESRPAPPPDDEGETAAPHAGDEGELEALEPSEGSGLHASPVDLRNQRVFPATTLEGRDELAELRAALAGSLPVVTGRRARRAKRGRELDLQRVLHAANRTGGEVLQLAWRERPRRPRRVLVLIDVSGSLRAHSPDLLRFAHAVVRSTDRAEAFTFGTRLTRVTRALDTPDVDRALAALSECVLDADGGTRIGPALLELLADGRHVALARGALIIVLSDGLERGDPAQMTEAVRRLARLGHRLVWWSPLACDAAYRPATRGLQAVLGQLDRLAGARDLATLTEQVRLLPETGARPRRTAARAWEAA
jgi:uncharacterized protein with von Willebrand factor type A (vWA) domain